MPRRFIRTTALLVTLGAGLALSSLTQARPASAAAPDSVWVWVFSGYTFPNTMAGYDACLAQGAKSDDGGSDLYTCIVGDPDVGRYNLWIGHMNPEP
jgi:hypothetical protein